MRQAGAFLMLILGMFHTIAFAAVCVRLHIELTGAPPTEPWPILAAMGPPILTGAILTAFATLHAASGPDAAFKAWQTGYRQGWHRVIQILRNDVSALRRDSLGEGEFKLGRRDALNDVTIAVEQAWDRVPDVSQSGRVSDYD